MDEVPPIGAQIERAITRMKTERLERRAGLRRGLRGRSILSGEGRFIGRNSKGELRHLNWRTDLGIRPLNHGLITILEKDPRNPGKAKEKTTDIFSAPRSRMKLRRSLHAAQENRDLILDQICEMEALVKAVGPTLSPLELYAKVSRVRALLGELEGSISITKQNAVGILETTEEALREASVEDNPRKKKAFLELAVQNMGAFRRQLGQIRDGEVQHSLALNRVREYVLREQRDAKVLELLGQWIREYSSQKAFFFERDQESDLEFAQRLEKLASSNVAQGKKLSAITALKKEYSVSEYGIRECRHEIISLLGSAETEFRIGEKSNRTLANKLLRRAALVLSIWKPSFVAEELQKPPYEVYLHVGSNKSIVSYIQAGAQLAQRNVFGPAVDCFRKAENLMHACRR